MGRTIVISSGKGGTGKTMFTANIGAMLAKRGHKVCLIDMDQGLRNLDLYLGMEDLVVYDVNDVLNGVCRIKQALIRNKMFPGLSFMAASPKGDSGEITPLHMHVLCDKLNDMFDYTFIDCPAGIDDGLQIALGGADDAIVVMTPEFSSIRDCDIVSKVIKDQGIKNTYYILNKVDLGLVKLKMEPGLEDIPDYMRTKIIGVIKDDKNIHISTNLGMPIVFKEGTYIYKNFDKIAERIERI